MPHSSGEAGTPADWLRHARSDLALALSPPSDDILPEALCFHAQQAVEKAFKAVLVHFGVEPPRAHNLAALAVLFPPSHPLPEELHPVVELTDYAVTTRYPGDFEEVTWEERDRAAALARRALEWAARIVEFRSK